MGLRLSHGNFGMAYSAFNRWRKFILESIGGSYPPHTDNGLDNGYWYWNTEYNWSSKNNPGLKELLVHDDCQDFITPEYCYLIIKELENIRPFLRLHADTLVESGHIKGYGGYMAVTDAFIDACLSAYKRNENLIFK